MSKYFQKCWKIKMSIAVKKKFHKDFIYGGGLKGILTFLQILVCHSMYFAFRRIVNNGTYYFIVEIPKETPKEEGNDLFIIVPQVITY